MSFEFVKELNEARVFRNISKLDKMKIGKLADSFFYAILGLEILRRTDEESAKKYAKQTLIYGNFNGWRTSATDLQNLTHVLVNKDRYITKLKIDRVASLPEFQFRTYLRNISEGKNDESFNKRFLFLLQRNLRIEEQGLRSSRRIIADWDKASTSEKQLASTRIYMGLYKDLNQTDFWFLIYKTLKRNKLVVPDAEVPKSVKMGTPLWNKMVVTGVASHSINKKLFQYN